MIGGLGPGATIHYYRELVNANAGEMLVIHADMSHALGYVTRGDRDGLAAYFARLIERLAGGGAQVAAISAITPHICIRELEKITPLPLVNIVEEIGRRDSRARLPAGRLVRHALRGGIAHVRHARRRRSDGAGAGGRDSRDVHADRRWRGRRSARHALAHRADLSVDAIVLAGTDLSLVFDETNTPFPNVDGAKVHIRAIMRELNTRVSTQGRTAHEIRRGVRLEYFTIAYNSLEAVIALVAGILAGSIALVGFGLDSVVEVTSGAALLWRLRGDTERREAIALKTVGVCFLVLAAYVAYEAAESLLRQRPPERSAAGIALAAVSLIVMPLLARAKRRVAGRISSAATEGGCPANGLLRVPFGDSACRACC